MYFAYVIRDCDYTSIIVLRTYVFYTRQENDPLRRVPSSSPLSATCSFSLHPDPEEGLHEYIWTRKEHDENVRPGVSDVVRRT